jgi:trimeric autotransporter adhesin
MTLIRGTIGDDRLTGCAGKDRIIGDLGDDWIAGGDGNDRLTGDTGDPNDLNVGFDDFVFDRHDGTDTITDFQVSCPVCLLLPGQPVDQIVLLDAAEAEIDAVVAGVTADCKGNAVLHYGETDIVLAGIAPANVSANWFTSAGPGIDLPTIEGSDGPDKLVGTNSDDRILGLKGDDRIVSRNGDDFMTGGAGADHYVFDQQDGTDTITDFTPWGSPPECDGSELCIALAVPLDRIVLKGGTQADIEAAVAGVIADSEGDALIHYGQTDIVLTGIQPSEVTADWFLLC